MTDVIRLFGPLVLWLTSFSAIYGLQAVLCREGWDPTLLVAAWGLAIVLQGTVLWALIAGWFGTSTGLTHRVSLALGIVALVAVIWTLAPVAFLPTCAEP